MTALLTDATALLLRAMRSSPHADAIMSAERPEPAHRFVLWRVWNPGPKARLLHITMLNPSVADHRVDDRTILSCTRLAKALGYDGFVVTNLFAYRATDPKDLKKADRAVGPNNDLWIDAAASVCELHVAAWGAGGNFRGRDREVTDRLRNSYDLHAFRLLQNGEPEHPLYLPTSDATVLYRAKRQPSEDERGQ